MSGSICGREYQATPDSKGDGFPCGKQAGHEGLHRDRQCRSWADSTSYPRADFAREAAERASLPEGAVLLYRGSRYRAFDSEQSRRVGVQHLVVGDDGAEEWVAVCKAGEEHRAALAELLREAAQRLRELGQ